MITVIPLPQKAPPAGGHRTARNWLQPSTAATARHRAHRQTSSAPPRQGYATVTSSTSPGTVPGAGGTSPLMPRPAGPLPLVVFGPFCSRRAAAAAADGQGTTAGGEGCLTLTCKTADAEPADVTRAAPVRP